MALVHVIALWALREPVQVPGRPSDVEWVVSPLLAGGVAATMPLVCGTAYEVDEILTAQPVRRRRWWATVALFALAVMPPILGNPTTSPIADIRNSLLLSGLALTATVTLPAVLAWTPVVAFPMVCWLLGARPPGEPTPAWALLLADRGDVLAGVGALAAAGVGAIAYISIELPRSRR